MLVDLDPSVFSIAAICLATVTSFIVTLIKGANWLSIQFANLKQFLLDQLDKHEDKDQHRHEDNLQRFATLETIVKNGHTQ